MLNLFFIILASGAATVKKQFFLKEQKILKDCEAKVNRGGTNDVTIVSGGVPAPVGISLLS